MSECQILWARYQTAMGLFGQARNEIERDAWWSELEEAVANTTVAGLTRGRVYVLDRRDIAR